MSQIATKKTWIALVIFLLVLLVSGWLVYDTRFDRERVLVNKDAKQELKLVSTLLQERLQKKNYQLAKTFIAHWGEKSTDVVEIILSTENGFRLGHYLRSQSARQKIVNHINFEYSYQGQAQLTIHRSVDHVYTEMKLFVAQLLTGFFFIAMTLYYLTFSLLRVQKQKQAIIFENDRRKRAEKSLQESIFELKDTQDQVHLLLDSTAEAIYGINTNGYCTFANQSCLNMLGYDNDTELLGQNMHDLIHYKYPNGDNYPVENCHIFKAFQDEEDTHIDTEVLWRKDGSSFAAEYWSHPIFKDNSCVGAVVTFLDITLRIETQRALYEREQDLDITLNSIGDGVITTDTSGLVKRMNPVAERLTGWLLKDALGKSIKTIFAIVDESSGEPIENPIDKVIATGKTVYLSNHTTLIGKDGTEYYIADSAAPILDGDGDIKGMVLIFNDVTQHKLQEELLRRSQKMDAIGQLSGGIAHDFNNQLNIVIGYLDFLNSYFSENEKPYKWVKTASKATMRCIDLTRQLLSFSRRQSTHKIVLNINSSFKDLETMIARSVTPNIDVQYFLADDLWLTAINNGEFQDTIINLVINARDAMPEGGKILIETTNKIIDGNENDSFFKIKAGEYVQLVITDTGTGMTKKTLEHIFEPFYTTKADGKGTGLGMSMVYGFTKRYDGHIKIYSEPGVGTTIRLFLPRSLSSIKSDNNIIDQKVDIPKGTESVLIVDDEEFLLELAEEYFFKLGYQTQTAVDGIQALELLKQDSNIDLLFTDVVMPGINGYDLADQATQMRPNLKVLLTSGFTSKSMVQHGLEKFAVNLLSKPYRIASLANRVRLVLDEE